jgi:hypothetical protein
MRSKNNLRTWRLFELGQPLQPCPNCGDCHPYLTQPITSGMCHPVLFPPGTPGPPLPGHEAELLLAGPPPPAMSAEVLAYSHLEARVREMAIRCERCGERFEDLEDYRLHPCDLHYR